MDQLTLGALALFLLFFVLLVLAFVYSSRYKKVGPNEVLVVSGRGSAVVDNQTGQRSRRSFRIVRGGGTFIWPVVERVDDLSLELMTIDVITTKVYTAQGVPVTVDGVAQVKIGSDDVSIITAAEQFLSKKVDQIKDIALQTLEGHLRGILGTLTVEEIYKDRDKFAQRVQEVSALDLKNMGLVIISFTIKNIHDDQGYLDALGQGRIAEVKRDAAIGQANAARDAAVQAAKARQEGEIAKLQAETRIAEASKNYQVQKAAYDAETNQKKAEAELAYVLQQNITNQKVKAEEIQISVVEKAKQIELQQQEALRKEKELEATVRKPAEAEQFRIRTLADAKKYSLETEAMGQASATSNLGRGDAEANKARGLAEADVNKAQGLAQADVVKAQGLSQAEVIQAQGLSEAEAMSKKAEAFAQYSQAAILQMLINNLPALASAIAQPLAKTEKIVVISSGGDGNSGTGVTKVTKDVADALTQLPAVVEALTGTNLIDMLKNLPGLAGTTPKPESSPPPGDGNPDSEK
ncbi:MAG: SPFH domain-containing protein [Chloroflexota bacterium]